MEVKTASSVSQWALNTREVEARGQASMSERVRVKADEERENVSSDILG